MNSLKVGTLKIERFDEGRALEYRQAGHDCAIEEASAFLTLLWDVRREQLRGIRVYKCSELIKKATHLLSLVGKRLHMEDITFEFLVQMALIGVHDRYLREHSSAEAYRTISGMISRFVSGVAIPYPLLQEVCDV